MNWLRRLFKPSPYVSHYTTDGGRLAPHPDMTDYDLYVFEKDLKVPNPTWPTLADFHRDHPEP